MRWIFGLGGILITLLIIVFLLSAKGGPGDYMVTTLKKGQDAQGDARQLAGMGDDGMKTKDSIVMTGVPTGGRTGALAVSSVVAGGPMQKHFGLMANDLIVEIGPQRVRDIADAELAEALALEAYQRQWTLIVERNGTKLALPGAIPVDGPLTAPTTPTAAPATPAPSAVAAPVAPASPVTPTDPAAAPPAAPPKRSSIYDQVNQIPGVQRADQ